MFTEDVQGKLVAMRPSAPSDENALEELIARYPEIVAEAEGELLLVRRQQGVPDMRDGVNRWALDVLFVTREAVPVLIEVKRASNSDLRRRVVGQLLDYAANGTAHWPAGEIQRAFEAECDASETNAQEELERFLKGTDSEGFWQRVDENLANGRVRLVVAADEIRPELARIVEFLNDQMRADVRAVELGWFESADGRKTLVPRIIGVTERARAAKGSPKPPIPPDQWITEHYGDASDTASGIRCHLAVVDEAGLESGVSPRHDVIWSRVGNRYPFQVYRSNHGIGVSTGGDESLRDDLVKAVGELDADKGTRPRFRADRLNDPEVRARYLDFVKIFKETTGLGRDT
ncbi:MAG: hypothetical protein F4174_11275 [Acidobacteria bacterium]|nr:hypothetical protein [Acidobacteriota bacterium]